MTKYGIIVLAFLCIVSAVSAQGQEKVFRAHPGKDGVQRIEMIGGGYFFKPGHIVVKVGIPVELIMRKEAGMTPHSIVLKAPGAGIDFAVELTTEPKFVRFTPTKAGIYEFYCDKKLLFLESHREKGMHGVLEVVD